MGLICHQVLPTILAIWVKKKKKKRKEKKKDGEWVLLLSNIGLMRIPFSKNTKVEL